MGKMGKSFHFGGRYCGTGGGGGGGVDKALNYLNVVNEE